MDERIPLCLLVTCEHGGNDVPARYADLFAEHRELLESHRGHDPGSLPLARRIARQFCAPLIYTTITRLLVEVNRSPHHRSLFSQMTRNLSAEEKASIIAKYYTPHRNRVHQAIASAGAQAVLHLAVHTFTPVLGGVRRTADVGLLYDPSRDPELDLCRRWGRAFGHHAPDLRVRMNYPYRGASDGLTTWLRRVFPAERYRGIELEVNQGLLIDGCRWPADVERAIVRSLAEVLSNAPE